MGERCPILFQGKSSRKVICGMLNDVRSENEFNRRVRFGIRFGDTAVAVRSVGEAF